MAVLVFFTLCSFVLIKSVLSADVNLCWLTVSGQKTDLNCNSGDPSEWLSKPQKPSLRTLSSSNGVALSVNPTNGLLYWSEQRSKQIFETGQGNNADIRLIYGSTSSKVYSMTVDWLAENIYWADALYNSIMVSSLNSSRLYYSHVVTTDLDEPMGTAVDPYKRYLFWSDVGAAPKIERSSLTGEDRQVLVTSDLSQPSGITLDESEERVYWVDTSLGTINNVKYDGTNRQTVDANLKDGRLVQFATRLDIVQDYIFVTEQTIGSIHVFNKTTMSHLGDIGSTWTQGVRGMTVFQDTQKTQSPCDTAACDHICTNKDLTSATCMCSLGYEIQPDGRTCSVSEVYTEPRLIYVNGTSLCSVQHNSPDLPTRQLHSHCFFKSSYPITALAFNAHEDTVYYSVKDNKGEMYISKIRLATNETYKILLGGASDIQGLAVDWINSHIYWTDAAKNHIMVSMLDGRYQKAIIENTERDLGAVAVDPIRNRLFWSCRGKDFRKAIWMSYLDGSEQVILRSTDSTNKLLAIDFNENTLYFADEDNGAIESMDLETSNSFTVTNRQARKLHGLAVYKDYLAWTSSAGLHFALKETGNIHSEVSSGGSSLGQIITYDSDSQTEVPSACDVNSETKCKQLCFPTDDSRKTCQCEYGYNATGTSCVSETLVDNFILVTDTWRRHMYQINLDNPDDIRAVNVSPMDHPQALQYDKANNMVYWSDVEAGVIKRSKIDGTHEQTIILMPKGSAVMGLATDFDKKKLFYTDEKRNLVGSMSLDGYGHVVLVAGMHNPRAITVDPTSRLIYYATHGLMAAIYRITYTGSHRTRLITGGMYRPNALEIDYKGYRIYWCDGFRGTIEYANLDGTERKILLQKPAGAELFGLFLQGDFLYYTDWNDRSVYKINRNQPESSVAVSSPVLTRLNDIIVVTSGNHEQEVMLSPSQPQGGHSLPVIVCSSLLGFALISIIIMAYFLIKWSRGKRKGLQKKKVKHTANRPQLFDNPLAIRLDSETMQHNYSVRGATCTPHNEMLRTISSHNGTVTSNSTVATTLSVDKTTAHKDVYAETRCRLFYCDMQIGAEK